MKTKRLLTGIFASTILLSFAGAFTAFAEEGDVAINNTNFPDDVFRKYVSKNCDTDGNGFLSQGEIEGVDYIGVTEKGITDLKGIEYFTALTELSCGSNKLESLNVSKNTALTYLSCASNQLSELDVSNNTALTELRCFNNKLTNLDVSSNPKLTSLFCGDNQFTSLDVSKNTALTKLNCINGQLTSLDVSNNTALTELWCENNQLVNLNVGNNKAIKELWCDKNRLTSLDVSQATELTDLSCRNNQLNSLNVSGNTALTRLYCYDNQLNSLDVSKNTALTGLYCSDNQLKSLDVSKNAALTNLYCSYNQLKSLDVSHNEKLTALDCLDNHLTSLDLSKNTALTTKYLTGNTYSIGKVTSYDLKNLPGNFDISKASYWQGATCKNGILTNITSDTITYSYDCGNKIITTFTLIVSENADDSTSDPVAEFVERLYTTLLGRPSEEEGKAGWVADLKNGKTAADVASGFVLSEELKNQNLSNSEFIDRMYRTFLDREADAAGKADWVGILDKGCSYGYILNSFAGSQEFNNLCDKYGIKAGSYESTEPRDKNLDLTSFVSRMYTKALGRAYDTDGLNSWTGDYLDGKKSADDIAYGFILSEEFTNKGLTDEAYVDTLYRTFFDREPDEDGKASWLDELNNGASRQSVLDGFLGTPEFANLKASFGV